MTSHLFLRTIGLVNEGPWGNVLDDVFLSHSREDFEIAHAIARDLRDEGLEVFIDTMLRGGVDWSAELERRATEARCVVVLWSPRSRDSKWVKNEASVGAERHVLIPAMIENCKPPMEFRSDHYANLAGYQEGNRDDARWRRFVGDVRRICRPNESRPLDFQESLSAASKGQGVGRSQKLSTGMVAIGAAGFLAAASVIGFVFWPKQPGSNGISGSLDSDESPLLVEQAQPAGEDSATLEVGSAGTASLGKGIAGVTYAEGQGFGVSMELGNLGDGKAYYSVDNREYQRFDTSGWFSLQFVPASKQVMVRVERPDGKVDTLRYEVDFSAIKIRETREAIKLSANTGVVLLRPKRPGAGSFEIGLLISGGGMSLQPVVGVDISKCQIKIKNDFWLTLDAQNGSCGANINEALVGHRVSDGLAIKVNDRAGNTVGPSIFDVSIPELMRKEWKQQFREASAIECRAAQLMVKEPKDGAPSPADYAFQTFCEPSYGPVWLGVKAVEFGFSPSAINKKIVVDFADEDILPNVKSEFRNEYVSKAYLQQSKCSAANQKDCYFRPLLPDKTEEIFARFSFWDGSVSEVYSYKINR